MKSDGCRCGILFVIKGAAFGAAENENSCSIAILGAKPG